jgi:hypothetical protein
MPAHRSQLLASFRRCLCQPRLARLYVRTQGRLQRYRVASAPNRDATGLSRGGLITTGRGLISCPRHLSLTSGDSGRGLISARHLLLPCGNPRSDFVDATGYQLLTGNDPIEVEPYRVEVVAQHRVKLPLIGVGGGRHSRRDRVGSFLDSCCVPRGQPTKLRVRICDHRSRRVAIRPPSESSSYTRAKRDQ